MKSRVVIALLAVAIAVTGCRSATSPTFVTVPPVEPQPAETQDVTNAIPPEETPCDREASLRPSPGPQPQPGAMPPGSTMEGIANNKHLIVGVDQNTYLFGFRDPASGQLQGFDIDLARELARSIFGDPAPIILRVVNASERESALQSRQVDLVVRTYSITCNRKRDVLFSTAYFHAQQRILALKGSGIDSTGALAGKRVCGVSGTTSLTVMLRLDPRPTLSSVASWTDCLVMLQQQQVDAISTDDTVLFGLAAQDPNLVVVGPSIAEEPYGIGINKDNPDLVRFVNGVLDRMRVDGTWQSLYEKHLKVLGPTPAPPIPRYQD